MRLAKSIKSILITGFCLSAATSAAFAEEAVKVDPVIVTATRTEKTVSSVGGNSVTVITAKEIENKNLSHLSDIIKQVPGISIARNGGPGTLSSIFIRGAGSGQTLVMLDGVMLNDPSSPGRSADIGSINLDNIERIEIVKGSQSVLYGSNAAAGVVNIITKKGEGKTKIYLGMEKGSYNTNKFYMGANGKADKLSYSVNISTTKSEGFSVANTENDDAKQDSDKDGYQSNIASANLNYEINEDFDISLVTKDSDSRVYTDSIWSPDKKRYTDKTESTYKVKVHNFFLDRNFESALSYGETKTRRKIYVEGARTGKYDGANSELNWQGNAFIGESNILTFGASRFTEKIKTAEIDKKVNIDSYYLQEQLIAFDEALDIIAGARSDKHEEFGQATTYKLAPSFKIKSIGTKLKASYGTGFKAPALYQMYADSNAHGMTVKGNPDLDPETSRTYDFGFEQELGEKALFSATWFNMEFEDKIVYNSTGTVNYNNDKGKSKTLGLETFLKTNPTKNLTFDLNYTYTNSKDADGNRAVRVAQHKYGLNSSYRLSDMTNFNLSAQRVGDRPASTYATEKDGTKVKSLDGYTLVNAAFNHNVNKDLKVYGRVDNLTDEEYEECWGYATPGRSFTLGVKYTFQ